MASGTNPRQPLHPANVRRMESDVELLAARIEAMETGVVELAADVMALLKLVGQLAERVTEMNARIKESRLGDLGERKRDE